MDALPGLPEVYLILIAAPGLGNGAGQGAVRRHIAQGDVDQGVGVAFHKGGALQGRSENFRVHALLRMIDDGVLAGILSG